jgi:hypothetical protein
MFGRRSCETRILVKFVLTWIGLACIILPLVNPTIKIIPMNQGVRGIVWIKLPPGQNRLSSMFYIPE